MEELFNKCELCPRKCMVNRNIGEIGYCRASNKMKIGGYHLHMWEEPVITGDKGSGTIFFSYCNLRCVYCQNYDISFNCIGEEITVNRLADIMIELQDMGALNINLVTPSHYIPLIRDSIIMAKDSGLTIPIIYNTSGYDRVESLKLLEGLIDIYLPDFKYYNDKLGKYSNISNYFETASLALKEMYRQVGKLRYNKDGILVKGMIVRHLVLPNNYDDSKKFILSYKIENGKIVAKLASGESCTVPYSEENENKIISRMEEQARYAQPKPLRMLDKILTISQPLMLPIAIMNFVNNGGWFYGMFLAIIVEGAIYYPAKTIINAIKKRDIKKLNYFLDHKEELNENIEKSEKSENIKLGVSKKAIKQIELQKSKNKQPFNINNIDNYSLSDLKALRENIKRISTFGFNEEETILEDTIEKKGPVLKMTLDNKRK